MQVYCSTQAEQQRCPGEPRKCARASLWLDLVVRLSGYLKATERWMCPSYLLDPEYGRGITADYEKRLDGMLLV